MPTMRLAAKYSDEDTLIVVPIPMEVAQVIGCRPNAVVCLLQVDGELKVLPYTSMPKGRKSTPNTEALWESCSRWWRERGSK